MMFAGVALAVWLGLAGSLLDFNAQLIPVIAAQIQEQQRNATGAQYLLIKGCAGVRGYHSGNYFIVECKPPTQARARKWSSSGRLASARSSKRS